MAQRSVVVSFHARGLAMGDATAHTPGLVLRLLVRTVDMRDDHLAMLMEADQGSAIIDGLVDTLRTRYNAEVQVLWDDPLHWRARVVYHHTDEIRDHPVYGPLWLLKDHFERAVLHFESGLSVQRYDLRDEPGNLDLILDEVRRRAAANGISCMVRVAQLDSGAMAWSPLLDPKNLPTG